MLSPKKVTTVLIEAIIVGVFLILFNEGVSFLFGKFKMTEIKYFKYLTLFLSGALFHLVFEYTGINKWYVENYFK